MLTVEQLATPPAGFFEREGEGRDFYAAYGDAGIENFEVGYFAVKRDDRIVTAAPYFVTRYAADTLVEDRRLKPLFGWIGFKVACIGHPSADFGLIDGEISADVLAAINAELLKLAPVIAYANFRETLPLTKEFSRVASLPVAELEIRDDHFSTLSRKVRRNLRIKMRASSNIRAEECAVFPHQHAATMFALYLNTFNSAAVQFDKLTPRFFENMGACGKYSLYWDGADLIGFSLVICHNNTVYAKYLGMDYARGREFGLYFLMFIDIVKMCMRDGYRRLQSGQTSYEFKRRIGSALVPTWIYFTARNPLLRPLVALIMWLTAYREKP